MEEDESNAEGEAEGGETQSDQVRRCDHQVVDDWPQCVVEAGEREDHEDAQ